jgi:hypothetical protein
MILLNALRRRSTPDREVTHAVKVEAVDIGMPMTMGTVRLHVTGRHFCSAAIASANRTHPVLLAWRENAKLAGAACR